MTWDRPSFFVVCRCRSCVVVRKPGEVTASLADPSQRSSTLNPNEPSPDDAVCASTPTRLRTDTCAPTIGAPDGSTILPLISAAERQPGTMRQASRPETKNFIDTPLPREPVTQVPPAGLLTYASSKRSAFPSF